MSEPSLSDLSSLCLACGLCCSGTVFTHVTLDADDRVKLQQAGKELINDADRINFPCQFLCGSTCSAYKERPKTCAEYRCETLIAAQSGKIGLDDAHQKIASVVALNDKFIRTLPEGIDVTTARQLIGDDQTPPQIDHMQFQDLRLAFVALQAGIDRHIRRVGEEVVLSMPTASED